MHKNKGVFLALIFALFFCGTLAQAAKEVQDKQKPVFVIGESNPISQEQLDNCSNYYKFGSIEMNLSLDKPSGVYAPVQEVEVRGSLKNTNGYPVSAGKVLIKIFQKMNSGDLEMDEFYLSDKDNKPLSISLSQNGTHDFSFKYPVPLWGPGKYYFELNYLWNDKRIISKSSPLIFDVSGGKTETRYLIDAFRVKANDKNFYSDNLVEYNIFENVKDLNVEYSLVNPYTDKSKINVFYKLYKLNYFDSKNIISDQSEEIQMDKDSAKKISKNFSNLNPGFYVLEIFASGQGIKTIARFNFMIIGEGMGARINFATINDFPIIPKSPAFGFVCYNSFSEKYQFNGKLILKLRDSSNNIVFTTSTERFSSLQNVALKNDFLLDKKYSKLWLDISLVSADGYTIDQTTLEYNCADIKNVGQFQTSVSGSTLRIVAQNKCGEKVSADILVEVKEKGGGVIFSEAAYGQDFKKKVKFQSGKEYEIKVSSQGFQDIIIYKHSQGNKIIYFVLGLVLLGGLIYLSNYFNKKQNNPVV
ncbi:hypothetical protein KBC01_00880 [Candidatus Parcubacteria bacterium]|nr:hypothetical protein [Candidatus Parcubacteria bacterium]